MDGETHPLPGLQEPRDLSAGEELNGVIGIARLRGRPEVRHGAFQLDGQLGILRAAEDEQRRGHCGVTGVLVFDVEAGDVVPADLTGHGEARLEPRTDALSDFEWQRVRVCGGSDAERVNIRGKRWKVELGQERAGRDEGDARCRNEGGPVKQLHGVGRSEARAVKVDEAGQGVADARRRRRWARRWIGQRRR